MEPNRAERVGCAICDLYEALDGTMPNGAELIERIRAMPFAHHHSLYDMAALRDLLIEVTASAGSEREHEGNGSQVTPYVLMSLLLVGASFGALLGWLLGMRF